MSIERVILATSKTRLANLFNFMKSLWIKNTVEADMFETTDTFKNYIRYKNALEKTDSVYDYNVLDADLTLCGFANFEIALLRADMKWLQDQHIIYADLRVETLLDIYRKQVIDNYAEMNPYYRIYLGLPRDDSEILLVKNNDGSVPEFIPVHKITQTVYPLTYLRMFGKRDIDKQIAAYPDMEYLNFIEHPLSVYLIREYDQFAILRYSSEFLTNIELNYFMKAYKEVKAYLMNFYYISVPDTDYPLFSQTMLLILLSWTFQRYQNFEMERYSLENYTDDEIYQMLDGYGMPNLKQVSIQNLRKIIRQIPFLLSKEGTLEVFKNIVSLIAEDVGVKRYYLVKKYLTDSQGHTMIDPTKTYEENISLEFVESTVIASKTQSIQKETTVIEYHDFVDSDDLWGGVGSIQNVERKFQVKENIRKELLKMDLTQIPTKYMTISKVVDALKNMHRLTDLFGLYLQIDEIRNHALTKERIFFRGTVETTPLTLLAALSWMLGKLSKIYSDPDLIRVDASTLHQCMILREKGIVPTIATQLETQTITLSSDFSKKKLKDIIPGLDFKKYITGFAFDANTSIADIFAQYETNLDLIYMIRETMAECDNFEQYQLWETFYNCNIQQRRIQGMYNGFTRYSDLIQSTSLPFYNIIQPIIELNDIYDGSIQVLAEELLGEFQKYIFNRTNGNADLTTDFSVNGEVDYLADLKILLNEFASIYTELYKVEFTQSFSDVPFNSFKFYYQPNILNQEETGIAQFILKEITKNNHMDTIDLEISVKEQINVNTSAQDTLIDYITFLNTIKDDFQSFIITENLGFEQIARDENLEQHLDEMITIGEKLNNFN